MHKNGARESSTIGHSGTLTSCDKSALWRESQKVSFQCSKLASRSVQKLLGTGTVPVRYLGGAGYMQGVRPQMLSLSCTCQVPRLDTVLVQEKTRGASEHATQPCHCPPACMFLRCLPLWPVLTPPPQVTRVSLIPLTGHGVGD